MSQPLRVVATIPFKPGNQAAADAAIGVCIVETRKEAGCREYSGYRSKDRPDSITMVELWDDKAALEQHMDTPHFKALFAALGPLLDGKPEILTLDEIGG